ncbi:MAG: metallophosphatase family protein [Chloroflexi bacterium]|nr:metallophosphatase family protein [Chloroflexota bacterium]
MQIAIISDMHGNCVALDAVLADLQLESIDQLVCLGDAVQGGPQPSQVVSRLRELACPVVMGNADDWLISGEDSGAEQITEERRQKLDTVRDWQLTQLSEADIAFMKTFKPTIELPVDTGHTLLCYHGSPRSFDDVILPTTPDEEIRAYLEPRDDMIYTGGHTHVQFVRHFGRTFHFNPGSVGFAYRHDQPDDDFHADGWAEYAVLSITDGRIELTFRRIPFDVKALIDIYSSSGRPYAEEAIGQYSG